MLLCIGSTSLGLFDLEAMLHRYSFGERRPNETLCEGTGLKGSEARYWFLGQLPVAWLDGVLELVRRAVLVRRLIGWVAMMLGHWVLCSWEL